MEVGFDWKKVRALLSTRLKTRKPSSGSLGGEVILRGDVVVAAYCENESLTSWVGSRFTELVGAFPNRRWIVRSEADWEKSLDNMYRSQSWQTQIESLQENCPYSVSEEKPARSTTDLKEPTQARTLKKGRVPLTLSQGPLWQRHFLIEGLQGGVGRLLPERFGLLLDVSRPGKENQLAYLWIHRGKLKGFHEPDLTGLSVERRDDLGSTAKYLTEKYGVPSVCLSIPEERWQAWKESQLPWRLLAADVRSGTVKVAPFGVALKLWMLLRAAIGG